MAGPDELTFAPLGGVGEIGMNLSIYARHQLSRKRAQESDWTGADPRPRRPFRRHHRTVAEAEMPDLRHQIQCRAVRGQMHLRAQSAENPGHGRGVARPHRSRSVQCRVHSGGAFDTGIPCAGDPDFSGNGPAHRRLEDRSDPDHRPADRRTSVARTRRRRRAGADRRFHQRGAGRALSVGSGSRKDHHRTGESGQGPRRGDHVCFQRRAGAGGRRCGSRRRARGGGGRPRDGARGAGGARNRAREARASRARRCRASPTTIIRR